MKKLKAICLVAIVIAATTFAWSQTQQPKEKVYTFQLTQTQFNVLWGAVDRSTAEHVLVNGIKEVLAVQYNAQQDTTKKK